MNNVYLLDRGFNLLGVIDDYVSLIWRPAYDDVGDFELYVNANDKVVNLLQRERYLVRSSDISIVDGVTTYNKVMIIKGLDVTTDAENGDYLSVTGRELKFILNSRIVWQQTTLTGSAENAIRKLISENAINPTDPKRVIPALTLDSPTGLVDAISKQVTGTHLDKAISDICKAYGYGWDVYVKGSSLVAKVYKGANRSYSQTDRPYVVFSEYYDNLFNTEYQLSAEKYANCTLIGGEGEGTERIYTTVGNESTGLDRYELFTDARDVSSNNGEIAETEYIKLLQERGIDHLNEYRYTEGFSGELLSNNTFRYGVDYFMGDKVTVINRYNISKDVVILSVIEVEDANGATLVPQFNI